MDLDAEPIERTLGLVWDFHRDVFVLGAKAEADGKTKRDIIKSIFSIFPLAFLAPIFSLAKDFMQDIWRRTIKRWECIFFISAFDHFQNRREEFLTPNHLLLGLACPNLPPDVFTERDLSAKQKWRVAQALADQFWRLWIEEVIPNLNERAKWQQQQPNLEVGDIVVIIDSSSPRGVWPTGRVMKIFPGPDGVVRSVSLLTNGTERIDQSILSFCWCQSGYEKVRLARQSAGPAMLPSLRPARRFPLSRVWQRSKESRGNGEEGRSYRKRKRHFSFDTVERGHARANPPLYCDFSFCFVFCVFVCSLAIEL
jgi:hypothetical protein